MSDDWRDHLNDPKTPVLMTEWGKDQLTQLYGWAIVAGFDPANEYIEVEDTATPPADVELPPGRLSPHFKEAEFACRHCGKLDKYPPQKLLDFLEDIRTHFGAPININSGYRCPVHNKDVGGATQSRHMVGDAADFHSKGASPAELFRYSDKLVGDAGGVSEYDTFVHIDVRGSKARW